MNTHPTLTLILKGPAVGGGTSELNGSVAVTAPGVQNYTVALGSFTLRTPCAYASAAAALATGVAEGHIQVLGANVQYVTGGPTDFPNGLNVGPISFEQGGTLERSVPELPPVLFVLLARGVGGTAGLVG
jgi:hypothetical protein